VSGALVALRAVGLSTVQDEGRPGRMHEGVPPGGALVPEWLARANAAVDNAHGEAGIEVLGAATFSARGRVEVAADDGGRRVLEDGEAIAVECGRARVRYLAVRGGLDVPRVLGGRGTLLAAKLGGHEGRALRRGDVLAVGAAPPTAAVSARAVSLDLPAFDLEAPIRVVRGPDADAAPFDRLLSSLLTIDPRSDRVGVRLAGFAPSAAHEPRAADVSSPMVRGAVQLPPDGVPIVLGPDHPTTGGYPVVAIVLRGDQGRIAALPIGHRVRLVADRFVAKP
jgi:allophanate hydrolase subunit 2